jgi:hypothetical protein
MPSQKLQPSRALAVIKSDNANIPFPAQVTSGTNTSAVANKLVNSSATFITANVKPQDIVYNITDSTAATVLAVDNQTTLTLNANIFTAGSKAYIIYDAESPNEGCVLYVGGTGDLSVMTAAGDTVLFTGILAGSFIPVQFVKLLSTNTTATLVLALW